MAMRFQPSRYLRLQNAEVGQSRGPIQAQHAAAQRARRVGRHRFARHGQMAQRHLRAIQGDCQIDGPVFADQPRQRIGPTGDGNRALHGGGDRRALLADIEIEAGTPGDVHPGGAGKWCQIG
jgi:hypothetical protein